MASGVLTIIRRNKEAAVCSSDKNSRGVGIEVRTQVAAFLFRSRLSVGCFVPIIVTTSALRTVFFLKGKKDEFEKRFYTG